MNYLLDYDELQTLTLTRRTNYGEAAPFPHTVIDDFITRELTGTILNEFPSPDSPYWKQPDNPRTVGKQVASDPMKEQQFGSHTRRLIWELHSARFLQFLTVLTGIEGLLGDPYLAEGGLHQIRPGGFLNVHADFSHHDYTGLQRRVNLLIYLNWDWQDSYGGHLGLYDRHEKRIQKIAPIAKRAVIFSTSAVSFHGHPEPLTCPSNSTRRSLALYYYTLPTGTPQHRVIFP